MGPRNKIKQLIQENIFNIHEAYETKDDAKLKTIALRIKHKLSKNLWDGWNEPLKPFIYKHNFYKLKISYSWDKQTTTRPFFKTIIQDGYKRRVVNHDRNSYKKKVIYLKEITINKI